MKDQQRRPGIILRRQRLHFIFICDCSGGMAKDGKMAALNFAMREATTHLRQEVRHNTETEVLVQAIKFSDGARWHIADPTPIEVLEWEDLTVDGVTDMGQALRMVAEQMALYSNDKGFPPVLVLISDGQPTDDFEGGLQALFAQPWGKKAARLAIAMSNDVDLLLQRFMGNTSLQPLQARNPQDLVQFIKWSLMRPVSFSWLDRLVGYEILGTELIEGSLPDHSPGPNIWGEWEMATPRAHLKEYSTVYVQPSGEPCTVGALLGEGGQGTIYRATWDNKAVALKWYRPEFLQYSPDQRTQLEMTITKGKPSEALLWPLAIVEAKGIPGFGYLMPLREARFKTIQELLLRRVHPSFRVLATVGFQLANQYHALHSEGYCYHSGDVSSVFFDPQTGEVALVNYDDVRSENPDKPWTGVLGTPKFMAPEMIRREAIASTQTDLYSLAVLLFYIFCNHHPLEGKRILSAPVMDMSETARLYGNDPVFIFDPQDHSNQALSREEDSAGLAGANALALWPIYPQFLCDLFAQAFTVGLREPDRRVTEATWCAAMIRLRDSIMYCRCGAENLYDGERLKASSTHPHCWACQNEVQLPFRIRLGQDTIVMINHDSQLYPHHVDPERMYDFSQAVAMVVRHPNDKRIWGLKNLTQEKWTVSPAGKSVREVLPGQSVTLASGTQINFGHHVEGEIRA